MLSHGPGFGLWLTRDQMVFATPHAPSEQDPTGGQDVFRATVVGASADTEIVGLDPLAARSNYFIGNDPSQYHANVEQFGSVQYRQIYPGIDLTYHSRTVGDRAFGYDFSVSPNADSSAIALRWEGLTSLHLDEQGRLILGTSGGDIISDAPLLYQTDASGARQTVAGSYVIRENGDVGFAVSGSFDATACTGRTI